MNEQRGKNSGKAHLLEIVSAFWIWMQLFWMDVLKIAPTSIFQILTLTFDMILEKKN